MLLSMPITVFTLKPKQKRCPVPIASPYVFHGSDCQKSRTTYSKGCRPIGSGSPAALRRSWVRFPEGANFCLRFKKNLSPASCPKHCGARPNSQGDGPLCTGGAGVRGFSWPTVRRSFYLSNNAVGAVLPLQVNFFLNDKELFVAARAI